MTKQIYIIHENDEWVEPLREELKIINAPFKEWHMGRDKIDTSNAPPSGVFHNQDKSAWSWEIELRTSVEKF